MMRRIDRFRAFGRTKDLLPQSRAQLHQDLWVLAETNRKRGGFFVEVGALDGIRHSNTYLLEKEFGWTGIVVEPNPTMHVALARNRAAAISCKAVHSDRRQAILLCMPDAWAGLSSLEEHSSNDGHAAKRSSFERRAVVECCTIIDLLEEHAAPPHIDYMSIDTEGSELSILQRMDFSRYTVELFSIEHNAGPAESQLDALLGRHGYRRVFRHWSRWDAWYRLDRGRSPPRRADDAGEDRSAVLAAAPRGRYISGGKASSP
jgi:FkbM family methyltransferase